MAQMTGCKMKGKQGNVGVQGESDTENHHIERMQESESKKERQKGRQRDI